MSDADTHVMRESNIAKGSKVGLLSLAFVGLGVLGLGGCSSNPDDGEGSTGEDAAELTRGDAIARAEEWVNAKLKYCQSANHAVDGDTACSHICSRKDNAAWNPYRSDCSGLVSWAWGLPAPGRITTTLAPFNNAVSHTIPAEALMPGDAVNNTEHIMLFKHWVTPGHRAVFIEEPGCSSSEPYAHELTSDVSVSGDHIFVSYEGAEFTAIRYNNVKNEKGGSTSPDPSPSGPPGCHSDTLGRTVSNGVCVQSESDGSWYQCDAGNWTSEGADPAACRASYPLHAAGGCHSDTLGREVADEACVQSASNRLWYQCENGSWVDRWTDPNACNGVHPL